MAEMLAKRYGSVDTEGVAADLAAAERTVEALRSLARDGR